MNVNDGVPAEKRFKHPIGATVHKILWEEWDPIGVRAMGGPDDEYDSYVWPIISKITREETVAQIADYLDWVVNENMGLSGDLQATRNEHLTLASKLVALRG